ncbi:MAG: GLUG motif-containing protein, partial [Phycisphaerae bacterium]
FVGKTADGTESDILITLTFRDDSAYLTGRTVPPPNSADMFIYELDAVAWKKYGGGTGEPNDPYEIATAEDLMLLGESPEDYDKHFILTADIDLDPNLPGRNVFDRAVIAPDLDPNDAYSMFQGTSFMGVFNGDGHKILHLTIEGESYLGLFGQLGSEARIFQMFLEAVDIKGAERNIGSLVGDSHGILSQCYSTAVVSGEIAVGGLVGVNDGSVAKSYSTGEVCGFYFVGGLVGDNWGSITESHSTGAVSGRDDVGGLVGFSGGGDTGKVIACYSDSTVNGNWYVGGLVGSNYGSITESHSTGIFTGDDKVGGLVGDNGVGGSITESYSTGMVNGNMYVGGLVGSNRDTITDCYSLADVEGEDYIGGVVGINGMVLGSEALPHYDYGIISNSYSAGLVVGTHSAGGLVSYNAVGEITNSFWDIQTSGQVSSAGGTGKTTAEMQMVSTFLDAGWDFTGESVNGTEDIWSICEGTNYSRLAWQIPAGDFVCPDGITIDDFLFFIEHWRDDNCDSSNDYCQGTDLDLSGTVDEDDLEIFLENWLADVRSD